MWGIVRGQAGNARRLPGQRKHDCTDEWLRMCLLRSEANPALWPPRRSTAWCGQSERGARCDRGGGQKFKKQLRGE